MTAPFLPPDFTNFFFFSDSTVNEVVFCLLFVLIHFYTIRIVFLLYGHIKSIAILYFLIQLEFLLSLSSIDFIDHELNNSIENTAKIHLPISPFVLFCFHFTCNSLTLLNSTFYVFVEHSY